MNSQIRSYLLCTLAIAAIMLGACSEDPVAPDRDAALGSAEFASDNLAYEEFAVVQDAGFVSYAGVIGETNQYEIRVPTDWNGEFVLYSHGFVDSYEPIRLPDKDNIEEIRDEIVAMGYAFAYCSFRENGFAVKDGIWATRTVGQIFRSKVKEEPTYTWLMGHSLGGLVAVHLAEKYPSRYDGVLTIAGMIGGSRAEIDYMGDIWNMFELLYGDEILPGNPCELAMPPADLVDRILAAVMADQNGLGVIAALNPLPGRVPQEFVQSLITAIVFNYRGQGDLYERLDGDCAYDNCDRVYTERFPLPPGTADWVNATIPRYCRTNAADNYLGRYYEPTGRLGIEMISIHLAHDPIVPVFHEQLYAEKVAMNGNSALLEHRVLDIYGHTLEIPTPEIIDAFVDLRAKVAPVAMPLVGVN